MKLTKINVDQEFKAFYEWFSEQPEIPGAEEYLELESMLHNATVHEYLVGWCARAAKSEWISVEDSLPEIDEFVLVCRNWRGKLVQCVDRIRLYYDREKPKEEQKWYGFMYSDITHWQPLPAPPTTDPAA